MKGSHSGILRFAGVLGITMVAFAAGRWSAQRENDFGESNVASRGHFGAEVARPGFALRPDGVRSTAEAPEEELKSILSLSHAMKRHEQLFAFGSALASRDLSTALNLYGTVNNAQDRGALLDGILEVYARMQPEECLEFLRRQPPGILRNAGLQKTIALWAESDPAAALAKIPEVLRGADAHNAYLQAATTWAQVDPQAATSWALTHENPAVSAATFEHVAAAWAGRAPAEAIRFLESGQDLPPDKRALALRAVAGTWAASEPDAAWRWALALPENERVGVARVAFMNYAVQDPAGAAQKLAQITDGALLAEIAPEFAGVWGGAAPDEATRWAMALPGGDLRNTVIREIVGAWAEVDPAPALQWAIQLGRDEAMRGEAIREAAIRWDRFEPEALDQFLRTLSPAESQSIYQLLAQGAATETSRRGRTRP